MEIAHTLVGLFIAFYSDPLICMPMFLTNHSITLQYSLKLGSVIPLSQGCFGYLWGVFFFFFLIP